MELRKQGKDTFNEREQALTNVFNHSPAHVAVLHRRYDTLGSRQLELDERSASARASRGYTSLREKGELKRLLQAWSSHTASTRSPPLLLPVRLLLLCLSCGSGLFLRRRKSIGECWEDMSGT